MIGSEKIWERGAALTSRLQSFETEMLTEEENFAGLRRINRELIGRVEVVDFPQRVRLIKYARYYWLLLAEGHLTRRLFGAMVRRMEALPVLTDRAPRHGSKSGEGRRRAGEV